MIKVNPDVEMTRAHILKRKATSKFTSVSVADKLGIKRNSAAWTVKSMEKTGLIVKTGEQGVNGAYYYKKSIRPHADSNKRKEKTMIKNYIDRAVSPFIGIAMIEQLGVNKSEAFSYIKHLRETGYIRKTGDKKCRSNLYVKAVKYRHPMDIFLNMPAPC